MMQARWGSHGDYEIIALCRNSPQECFDLTIQAFNLAEEFRMPVLFIMDEVVGHMTEKVVIPQAGQIEVVPRRHHAQIGRGKSAIRHKRRPGAGDSACGRRLQIYKRGYPNMSRRARPLDRIPPHEGM